METLLYTFAEARHNADRAWQDELRNERLASDLELDTTMLAKRMSAEQPQDLGAV